MRLLFLAWVVPLLSGCMAVRYLPQAAGGQLKLMTSGRRIERVLRDPTAPAETRRLLAEVKPLRAFAVRQGLRRTHSYRRYIELDRSAVAWLLTASAPLAFRPKVYWFPIAGSFAGTGWFREEKAARHGERLRRRGWDVAWVPVGAYSTGGWFRDPIVSSMFESGPAAVGEFANVFLHESLHATVLVPNQTYFDESLASFVADEMTRDFLLARFGAGSEQATAYDELLERWTERQVRWLRAYNELEALYASSRSDREKLDEKRRILVQLQQDLELSKTPNNANLLGVKLYGTGGDWFAKLRRVCGSWPRFLTAMESVRPPDFPQRQAEDFSSVVEALVAWNCEPLPKH